MDSPNPPPEKVATSLEHFRQIEREERAAREAAATPRANTTADDFPDDPAEQCALVNQMVEAMQNMDGIVDNFVNNPNENDAVRFILSIPRKDLVKEGWKLLDKAGDAQRGILDPGAFSPEIPNFMTRWRLMVGTFRHCKAAVSDLFSVSFVQRYTANPAMELDTKVSNNHTNKMKKYNKEVDGARKYGGGATTVGDVTEARDGLGNVVERFIKPRKRPLAELLGEDLARFAVDVKRPRTARTRTATGGSAASGAASGATAAVGAMPAIPEEPAAMQEAPAMQEHPAPIQEELAAIQDDPTGMQEDAATFQEAPALYQEEEGSGPLAVSNGLSSPQLDVANQNPIDQYHALNHHQSLDGDLGYNSLNQYRAPPAGDADVGPLVPDQQPQQPANFMAFFNFEKYRKHNQPIAGDTGGTGGSQAAQGSGAAGESKN